MTCVASAVYAPLIKQLKTLGIEEVYAKELPSVDPQELLQPNPLEADIAAIRALLTSLIEEKGLEIVLVAHSYGGVPSLYAVEGLWQDVREKNGKKGGVTKIALISAAINLPGDSVNGNRTELIKQVDQTDWPEPNIEMTEKVS